MISFVIFVLSTFYKKTLQGHAWMFSVIWEKYSLEIVRQSRAALMCVQ